MCDLSRRARQHQRACARAPDHHRCDAKRQRRRREPPHGGRIAELPGAQRPCRRHRGAMGRARGAGQLHRRCTSASSKSATGRASACACARGGRGAELRDAAATPPLMPVNLAARPVAWARGGCPTKPTSRNCIMSDCGQDAERARSWARERACVARCAARESQHSRAQARRSPVGLPAR